MTPTHATAAPASKRLKALTGVADSLVGETYAHIQDGALRGHAGSKIFEDAVFEKIKKKFKGTTYRQHDFLNCVLEANPSVKGQEERVNLFGPSGLRYLLTNNKKTLLRKWESETEAKQIREGQQDTADIVIASSKIVEGEVGLPVSLVDLKTTNMTDKESRPPNIISIEKLAEMAIQMMTESSFDCLDLFYLGISYRRDTEKQTATIEKTQTIDLFKEDPKSISFDFNWSATQIQFHLSGCHQDFEGLRREWCVKFLEKYFETGEAALKKKKGALGRRKKTFAELKKAD